MKYTAEFSVEDNEWVATCDIYPSLSWLANTPANAIDGLDRLILGDSELAANRP